MKISMLNKSVLFAALAGCVATTNAELQAMGDSELSAATGEGLGFALEDFVLDSETANLSVTGIESSDGSEIGISWTDLYIMGEGSENGTLTDKKAQIGSYNHPWVFQTARGQLDVDSGVRDYTQEFGTVGDDIALLELATDTYENPLQDSAIFGQFSVYQGCTLGEPNCNLGTPGSTAAENKISNEIAVLESQKQTVEGRYTGLQDLEASIATTYTDIIVFEQDVEVAQQNYDTVLETVVKPEYDEMARQFQGLLDDGMVVTDPEGCDVGKTCAVGETDNCSITSNYSCYELRQTYNDQVGTWEDAVAQSSDELAALTDAKKALFDIYNDRGRPEGQGYSYLERVADRDNYFRICGFVDGFDEGGCADGLLGRKNSTLNEFNSIALAFNGGQRRRAGLDVGSTFEFNINSTDENGVVTARDDYLNINIKGLFIDSSAVRLWSRRDDAGNSELNGELRLNLFAKEIDISACNPTDCATPEQVEAATLNIDNLLLSLNLGFGEIQPMKFGADSSGNFEFELVKPDPSAVGINLADYDLTNTTPGATGGLEEANEVMQNFYNEYYANAPKSFIYIGDVNIGGTSLGSTTVDGLRSQYLKITSRDL